jgi:hypothetical protein
MILETILAALVPVGVEAAKQGLTSLFGGPKPTTLQERIELERLEIDRLRAVAELDRPVGEPSQWVVDLRASARYVAALVVIFAGLASVYVTTSIEITSVAIEAANIAFGFLFGARLAAGMRKK